MIGSPIPGTEDEIHIYRSGNLMRMEANGGKSSRLPIWGRARRTALQRTAAYCMRARIFVLTLSPFRILRISSGA